MYPLPPPRRGVLPRIGAEPKAATVTVQFPKSVPREERARLQRVLAREPLAVRLMPCPYSSWTTLPPWTTPNTSEGHASSRPPKAAADGL
jgi:hypothetical protein